MGFTNCVSDFMDSHLEALFYRLGTYIWRYPLQFIALGIVLIVSMGMGVLLLEQETRGIYLFVIQSTDKSEYLFPEYQEYTSNFGIFFVFIFCVLCFVFKKKNACTHGKKTHTTKKKKEAIPNF